MSHGGRRRRAADRTRCGRFFTCPDVTIGTAQPDDDTQRVLDLWQTAVLDTNVLGQQVWPAAGYHRQDDWGRWVEPAPR